MCSADIKGIVFLFPRRVPAGLAPLTRHVWGPHTQKHPQAMMPPTDSWVISWSEAVYAHADTAQQGSGVLPGSLRLTRRTFLNMVLMQSSDCQGAQRYREAFIRFIINSQLLNMSSVVGSQLYSIIWGFNQMGTNYDLRSVPNPEQQP